MKKIKYSVKDVLWIIVLIVAGIIYNFFTFYGIYSLWKKFVIDYNFISSTISSYLTNDEQLLLVLAIIVLLIGLISLWRAKPVAIQTKK